MKYTTILFLVILGVSTCKAQTFTEWYRQKETQKEYLIQQIAAFKVYLEYIQKGYSIAQKGLTTISNIKKGDFDLHNDFFTSLGSINPKIRSYTKVAAIIALQLKIVQVYKDTYKQVKASGLFNAEDANNIHKAFTNLLSNCTDVVNELIRVTTAGKLEMKDDDRLKRIDILYGSMQENYTFAQGFGTETKLLAVQRKKEKNNVETGRTLNGIKNK